MRTPLGIHTFKIIKSRYQNQSVYLSRIEIEYYRKYPDQIDQVTAPLNIHKIFLWAGALLGVVVVAVAKFLKFSGSLDFLSEGVLEFVIDIIYEAGIALIGAAVTAYMLGVLLNKQQKNATKWREEIRRRIKESEGAL